MSDKKSNHCLKTPSHSGVSSTQLSFKPRILRGFQKSLKFNPGKNYLKNFTYFFVFAEVIKDSYYLLRTLMCVQKTFT